jgi:uncharacterized protein YcfJ
MNIKALVTAKTKAAVGVIVLTLAIAASPVSASHDEYENRNKSRAVYDYARVVSAKPIVRYVTVTTPVKECWQETEYYTVENRRTGVGVRTIFGAIVGGIVGHQFGSGHGQDAATVAGTLIGASIGNNSAHRNASYRTTEHSRPVTRCKTQYQSREEERIEGYRVVYAYHGQKYATRMPNDPGKRLRIRVDVSPAV